MKNRLEERRRFVVPATALALVVSLIGGLLMLGLPVKHQRQEALKPVPPPISAAPTEPPSSADADLSMFGFDNAGISGDPASSSGLSGGSSAGLLPGGVSGGAGLPAVSVPPGAAPGPGVDWNSLLAPLIQAQLNAQSANVAGSIVGSTVGAVSAVLNSAAVLVGDLLLFAAVTNNGPNILSQLQNTLAAAVPAAAAAMAAQGVPTMPAITDLTGLTTAFAAAAAAPPLGVPQLPPLPQLPSPDQVAASLAGLSALSALPALPPLPPLGLPGLPPPPQLPKPEEVVGGAVAIGVGVVAVPLVLSLLLPPPPSITRMLGLPF